jgi:hypothetical protein
LPYGLAPPRRIHAKEIHAGGEGPARLPRRRRYGPRGILPRLAASRTERLDSSLAAKNPTDVLSWLWKQETKIPEVALGDRILEYSAIWDLYRRVFVGEVKE